MRPPRLLYFFSPRRHVKSRYGSLSEYRDCQELALTNSKPQNRLSMSYRYSIRIFFPFLFGILIALAFR